MIFKSTKIIATIGPATRSQEMIIGLYQRGVNVIRLNFSHKNYEEKAMVIDLVHTLNAKGITKLSLLLDTKGPEIRTGKKETPTVYQVGDMITISTHSSDCAENDIYCDYPYLLDDLKVGDTIKIDSGMFDVEVMEIGTKSCIVKALNTATIGSYRHINLPGKKLKFDGLAHQDQEDLLFGIQHGIHIVAISFVRNANDVVELRNFWNQHGGSNVLLFSKIENIEGIQNLDEIIQVSDGIMVARGDLGIEVDMTMIPVYQKQIVSSCHRYGKPVIIATQMIESMMHQPTPTRAEIHDIYQAVEMGADAVMLSGETAIGSFPLQAVNYMSDTIKVAELHIKASKSVFEDHGRDHKGLIYKHLIEYAVGLSQQISTSGIIIFTKSGVGAKILSAYRPRVPVLSCTWDPIVVEQLRPYYAIHPMLLSQKIETIDDTTLTSLCNQCDIQIKGGGVFIVISDTDIVSGHHPTVQIIDHMIGGV